MFNNVKSSLGEQFADKITCLSKSHIIPHHQHLHTDCRHGHGLYKGFANFKIHQLLIFLYLDNSF